MLGERWTLLVVSRLIDGCRRFSDIQRGVPRISPTLLATRLAQLQDAGLCERKPLDDGSGHQYVPTQACMELDPIVMQLAAWGQRWARDMRLEDLDPAFLAWSIGTRFDCSTMPAGRIVIEFEFSGLANEFRRFWLVADDGRIDMCLKNPGFDVDVRLSAEIRCFVEAWRGIRNLRNEITRGSIRVDGPPALARSLPVWLLGSALASEPRRRPGNESRLYERSQAVPRQRRAPLTRRTSA
ncbi:MAG: helix-turn-helix transcriptional regulator [Gammaproteobacteria bacterium]|nr:helix-turn-helix transcriptional regulator [Gammaproteobacteria bacterium]